MMIVFSLLVVLSAVCRAQEDDKEYTFNFDGCNVDEYYSSLSSTTSTSNWTRDELQALLKSTHRNQLPFTTVNTPGVDDVWAALIDIDVGSVPDTVKLLYTDNQIDAIPFGQRTWIKEHVHPIMGLLSDSESIPANITSVGKEVSDLHNIFPASVLSAKVRNDQYFGECGVFGTNCQSPAEGGADDTCTCDGNLYTPPESKKGMIARALLYMDLRYDGTDPATLDLRLTDCPRVPHRDMGYLSQMITWHFEHPPTQEEIIRNNQICQHWQGNRNPFVDHLELVSNLYYEPFDLPTAGERSSYEACDKLPTLPPTAQPNDCDNIMNPGDIYIFLLNSNDPDGIGLYSFVDVPSNLTLFLTDNPWNGTNFVNDLPEKDGTIQLVSPPNGGIPAATSFGYQEAGLEFSNDWTVVEGNFSLTTQGEAVFLYCQKGDGVSPKPLLAFSYGATYVVEQTDPSLNTTLEYNETSSSFPWSLGEEGLQNIQPHSNNVLFNVSSVPPSITTDALKAAMRDPENWIGNNSSRFGVESDLSSSATGMWISSGGGATGVVLVVMVMDMFLSISWTTLLF